MAATTKITDPQEIVEAVKIIEAQLDTYLKVKTNSGTFLVGPNKVDGQKDPVRANVIDNGAAVQMTGMIFKVKKSADWALRLSKIPSGLKTTLLSTTCLWRSVESNG